MWVTVRLMATMSGGRSEHFEFPGEGEVPLLTVLSLFVGRSGARWQMRDEQGQLRHDVRSSWTGNWSRTTALPNHMVRPGSEIWLIPAAAGG